MRKKTLILLLFVLLLSGMTGCHRSGGGANGSANYFNTSFQEESQFIVEAIVSDVAEELYFVKNRELPDAKNFSVVATGQPSSADAPIYNVRIHWDRRQPDVTITLNVKQPIWSPALYDDVAAALAQAFGIKNDAMQAAQDEELLKRLLNDKAVDLEEENQALSDTLANGFNDDSAHERAALLLGAFTLREHSGGFFDIRSPLCRMTTHLVIARYLNGHKPYGINGQVADAMLTTLMNDQTAALAKLDSIKTDDPTVVAWVRALRARNTADYRPMESVDGLSAVERIEWFRALSRSAGTDTAWAKLTDDEKKTIDFVRVADESGFSVGLGHELVELTMPLEFQELSAVYTSAQGHALNEKQLIDALNQMPEHCFSGVEKGHPRVRIIGWGQWAMFFQRQLGCGMERNFNFLQRQWGVPDNAAEFSKRCDKAFEGMRLYPFVRRFNSTTVDAYHRSVDDGFKVTVTTPQLVPAECWNYLCYWLTPQEWYKPNPNPHINEWHKHNPPPGTAYDPLPRLNHPSLTGHPGAVEKLHGLAPYDHNIAEYLWSKKYNEQPTYQQALELFQPTLEYDHYSMVRVANTLRDQPDRYEQLMLKSAAMNPSDYFLLGSFFENVNPDKAATYLEKGTATDPDAVRASYYSEWLVNYYLKHGRTNDARTAADFGGEVYSGAGLRAKAVFLEAIHDYDGAFEWYHNIEERYNEPGALIDFCIRYKAETGDIRFEPELQKRMRILFPRGIENVSLRDFTKAPTDGVVIMEDNDALRSAGLKSGDVIVAVNGIRVYDFPQYTYGRDIRSDPELDLIVWQGNDYHEIKASPPQHKFGADFRTYSPH